MAPLGSKLNEDQDLRYARAQRLLDAFERHSTTRTLVADLDPWGREQLLESADFAFDLAKETELEDEVAQLKEQNESLTEDLADLRKQLRKAEDRMENAEAKIKKLLDQLTDARRAAETFFALHTVAVGDLGAVFDE